MAPAYRSRDGLRPRVGGLKSSKTICSLRTPWVSTTPRLRLRAVCDRLIRDDRLFEVILMVDCLFDHKVCDIGT